MASIEYSKLSINEPRDFSRRFMYSMASVTLLALLIAVSFFISNRPGSAMTVGLLIFVLQYLKVKRFERTYITEIRFDLSSVEIIYKDKMEVHSYTGDIVNFSVEIRFYQFSRGRTPYLDISFNNDSIKQFETGDWNEDLFRKVVKEFDKRKHEKF